MGFNSGYKGLIHLSKEGNNEEDLHRTETGFHIMLQTSNVFITVLNICQLDISLANNVYCTCTCFPAHASGRTV